MAVSIHFCICQVLAGPLRRELYQVPVSSTSWHPQQSLGLVIVNGMDPQVSQSLDGHFFSLYSTLCLCNYFHGCFVPPSKIDKNIYTMVFLLLEFHVVCELYLGYSEFLGFWANIHSSVRFHLIPIRMTKIKNSGDSRFWQGCGERGKFLHC